ncbi:hypothetical protein [Motilibacter aurantiacus]|uniref:hypothetical protein n=1 Tax=Motilibacter aurantiacus TaxID=2714955 RepID=UPI00140CE7D6|nr:hypothetical protein [Motilibacter aurantiacus]NHC45324.1 hypothetical protein [Motilibacter aurantiacus]
MQTPFARRAVRVASTLVTAAMAVVVPAVGATPAHAQEVTTVRAHLTYEDTNLQDRPIAFSKVEIWRFAPRTFGIWTWANERTVQTDGKGNLTQSFPFVDDAIYALRVFATNSAVEVWPNDALHTQPFWAEPGQGSSIIELTSTSPNTTLSFDWNFDDDWAPQHYNLAETIRHGRDYATANRGDTDVLPQADVQPTSVTGSYYNPVNSTVVINSSSVFSDQTVLHEYGHFLQDKIGSFPWLPARHNGCLTFDVLGNAVNTAEHAWMEGFANWFAQAVVRARPEAALVGNTSSTGEGTFSASQLETPRCGALPASVTGDEVELFVAASLWDLTDSFGGLGEPADTVSGRDREVFQIMDKELDAQSGGPTPTIRTFRAAWMARGIFGLEPILKLNHVL